MLSSFLRRVVQPASRSGRHGKPRLLARPRVLLQLEPLEDRLAPASVSWVNLNGGAWETASNWSTGSLPGAADDVTIGTLNAGVTITHASDVTSLHSLTSTDTNALTLSLTGGSLALGAASTLSASTALNLSNASVALAGDLTLNGQFTWTGTGG
jgi:hypothetical protein